MGSPTIAELPLDFISGKDWKGAPIVPRQLDNVYAFEQYNSRTSLGTIEFAKKLKENFDIELSPIKMDYVIKSTMGYYSEYMKEYSDRLFWDYEKWGERPFQKGFKEISFRQFKKDERVYRNKYTSKYYKMYAEAIKVTKSMSVALKHMEERGDDSFNKNYTVYDHALVELQKEIGAVNKAYNEWQEGVLIGNRDPNKTAKEKENDEIERLKSKNNILESSYKQFKKVLDSAKKQAEKLKQENKQ